MFSKIFEKNIFSRIYSYLIKHNLIFAKHFDFRSNSSTIHALLCITKRIRELSDLGCYVCEVFVDLKKAFDTVNHNILCEKLNYGLRGNVNILIQSYLAKRKQHFSINGFESNLSDISCGVPQGSSLGPLLFLIYINDLNCLQKTETGHFADDSFIMVGSKTSATIETVVNHELKLVTKWTE